MRHGQFLKTPDPDHTLQRTTGDAVSKQTACPFGAYSTLFDASPAPPGKGARDKVAQGDDQGDCGGKSQRCG